MSSLSGAWLALALLQLVAAVGATLLGAGLGGLGRRARAMIVAGFGMLAVVAAIAALGVALSLVAVDWAWGAEKLVVAAPIGILGSVGVAGFAVRDVFRARAGKDAQPILFGILIAGAIGALIGPIAILLIGSVVTWQAVLAAALVWVSGSAVAVFATWPRPRRVVISAAGFAALSVALLALFTVFGPSIATAGTGHHIVTVEGDSAAIPVDQFRETDLDHPAHPFELEARHETIQLPDGSDYDAVTFGSLPGPELVVTEGELVEVTLTNRDVENGVTLHWHGYDVPSGDDGVAGVTQDAVLPGESFVYRFVADEPGTYWYHTHQDALEGIRRGLYGALIVLPAVEPGTQPVAETDVTALIHSVGGTTLVGADEVLRVPESGATRLRLGNTDQTPRSVVLDADVQLIALDGTDLAEPAALPAGTTLRIPAGGRADLRVDGGTPVTLAVERGGGSGVAIGGDGDPAELSFTGPEFDILDAGSGPLPDWALGPYDVEAPQVLDRLIRVVDGVPRLADSINGAAFPSIAPIVVDEGDIVEVTIINRGTEVHPMHLHGHHMIVLSRDGVAPTGALWLDTVDVRPGETWKVAFVADNPGIWMDHCHNLEHAAAGMVMHFAYTGVSSPFELGGEHGNAPE